MEKIQASPKIRIDKYLWAIRIFKTRSLAAEACSKGKVNCKGQKLKASYQVKIGDVYTIKIESDYSRIVEVIQPTGKRQSASAVKPYFNDLSPERPVKEVLPSVFYTGSGIRNKGTGRPTKKDRRDINNAFDF